jgi:signal transduction histidine kinase
LDYADRRSRIRVLLVDDDEDAYVITKALLEDIPDHHYTLDYVYRYDDAVTRILRDEHDVYLVDFLLGARTGLDLIEEVRARGCTKPIICATMMENHIIDMSIMKAGASDYLVKGELTSSMLERSIRYAIMHQRALNEVKTTTAELRHLNTQLKESEAELTELNQTKDKFFSIISHDLKSPFTSLLGFSELLANNIDVLTKDQLRDSAQRIYQSGRNLHRLLENLLQWSRLQTGRMPCVPTKISFRYLVEQVFALYRDMAEQKGVEMRDTVDENVIIFADTTMVQAIIENLVSNAIKFTPRGGFLEVACRCEGRTIIITVTDNGVGMEEQIVNSLFRIESHGSLPGTQAEEGTGLGLVICRELVERNNGSISVRSVPGQGSVFSVTLQDAVVLSATPEPSGSGMGQGLVSTGTDEGNGKGSGNAAGPKFTVPAIAGFDGTLGLA